MDLAGHDLPRAVEHEARVGPVVHDLLDGGAVGDLDPAADGVVLEGDGRQVGAADPGQLAPGVLPLEDG